MRYVTHCPSCGTAFKIVDDQLRIAQGWVRCGHCQAVYKAKETLSIVVDDEPPQSAAHSPAIPTPTPTATAATTRTNASTAHASASAQTAAPKVTSADPHAASAPVRVPSPTDDSVASEAAPAPASADAHDTPAQDSPTLKTSTDISDEASPAAALYEEESTVAPQPVASNSNMLDRIAAIVAAKKAALSKARPKAHAHSSAAANTTLESPPTDDHPTEPPKAHANNAAPLLLEAPTDTPKALPAPAHNLGAATAISPNEASKPAASPSANPQAPAVPRTTPAPASGEAASGTASSSEPASGTPETALLALTHTAPQKNEAASATESAPATLHTNQASDTINNKHARLTSADSLQTADGLCTSTSSTDSSLSVPAPLPSPDAPPPMLEWEPLTEAAAEPPIEAPTPASAPSAPTTQAAQDELPSSAVLPWQEGEPFQNSQPIVPLALTRGDDEAPGTPATDAASSPNTAPSAQQPEAATEPGNGAQQAADTAYQTASAAPVAIEASETDKAPDPDIATAHTIPASGSSTEPQGRTSEASKHSGLPSDPIDTDEVAAPSPNQASYQPSPTDRSAIVTHTSANTPGTALASASSTTPEAEPAAAPAVEKDKAADTATTTKSATESAAKSSPLSDATPHRQDQKRSTSTSPKTASETAAAAVTDVPANSGLAQSAHMAQAAAVPNKDATAPSGDNSSATSTSATPAAKTESDAEALLRRRALREKRRLKSKASARSRKRSAHSRSSKDKKPWGLKALWQALMRPFKRTPPAAPPVPVQPPALPVPAVRPAANPAVTPTASHAPAPSSHALPATPVASTSSAKADQLPLLASNGQAAASADTHKAPVSFSKASVPASSDHQKAALSSTAVDTAADSPTTDEAVVPAATPVAAIQATTPSATDAPPAAATASHDESFAFMRDAQRRAFWRKPQVRAGLAAGVVLGALTLAGQWAYQNRSPLAARMPLARATFEALRLPVPPWQNIQAIEIEDSDFLKNPDNSYQLRVSLRNSSTHPVAMPALELALLDDDEQVVTRRVVQADPALPMPTVIPPRGQWQATVEVWVQLPPELAQRDIAGYRVAVFYP